MPSQTELKSAERLDPDLTQFAMTQPLPDYYRILQVHPEAEPDVIEAAYRRLVRKYHPDVLTEKQRNDPAIQRKAQEINEAYDILSDPDKRQAYDRAQGPHKPEAPPQAQLPAHPNPQVEKRFLLIRCAISKKTFRAMLARQFGSSESFRVVGFEPFIEPARPSTTRAIEVFKKKGGWLEKLWGGAQPAPPAQPEPKFPSEAELTQLFDGSKTLEFSQINWAGLRCPDCNGIHYNPNGDSTTWFICGRCAKIACAGGMHTTPQGSTTRCPACGSKIVINKDPKSKRKFNVEWHPDPQQTKPTGPPLLEDKPKKLLPRGKDK